MVEVIKKGDRQVFELIHNLLKVVRFCQQDSDLWQGMTFSQFCILDAVQQNGGLELAQLHNILAVEKSTTTRLVDPLVEKKLLFRQKSESDLRVILLRLTATGRAAHSRIWESISNFIHRVKEEIPPGERENVFQSTRKFISALSCCCTGSDCCCRF